MNIKDFQNILPITLTAKAIPTRASFCMIECEDFIIDTTGNKPLFLTTDKIESERKSDQKY